LLVLSGSCRMIVGSTEFVLEIVTYIELVHNNNNKEQTGIHTEDNITPPATVTVLIKRFWRD